MVQTGLWHNTRDVWHDVRWFIQQRKALVAAFCALFLVGHFVRLLPAALLPLSVQLWALAHPVLAEQLGLALAALVQSALCVQIMRAVLLGSATPSSALFGRPLWRYLIAHLAIGVIFVAIAIAVANLARLLERALHADWPLYSAQTVLTMLAAFWIASYAALRLMLALGRAALDQAPHWHAAWRDSRGRFWPMLASYVLALLPVCVGLFILSNLVWMATFYGVQALFSTPPVAIGIENYSPKLLIGAVIAPVVILALVTAIAHTAAVLAYGACTARLYKRYAEQPPVEIVERVD